MPGNRHRLRLAAHYVALLGVSTLLAGCDQTSQKQNPHTTNIETIVPGDALPPSDVPDESPSVSNGDPGQAMIDEIAAVDDFFKWFELRAKYRDSREPSADVEAALATKEVELREKEPAKPISDALELVAFDWKMQGEDPGSGKSTTFNISWLFYKKGPIHFEPNHETLLILRGTPDKSHARYLADEQNLKRDNFQFEWIHRPPNDLDGWEEGEYILQVKKGRYPVPNVPHRMDTWFRGRRNNDDGSRIDLHRYGQLLDLGWHVDLGD